MFKRKTAYKVWIENLNKATPIYDAGKFVGLDFNGKKIQRVNIIGNVIDKFTGNNFAIITIDDSTGIIEVRDFDNGFDDIEIGDVVLVIGSLKSFNEKVYIAREIIKKVHPMWLLARKLELEKIFGLKIDTEKTEKEEIKINDNQEKNIKDRVLEKIKEIEKEKGEVNVEDLFLELEMPVEEIKKAIDELLEEAKVYEPRPGILKVF